MAQGISGWIASVLVVLLGIIASAPEELRAQQSSPVMRALVAEMQRTIDGFKSQKNPPYFLSYSVTEMRSVRISASMGKIELEDASTSRVLDIDVRVGDYSIDNTHIIRGSRFEMGGAGRGVELPMGDDEKMLRSVIWAATDRAYKRAAERYGKVLTNLAVKVKDEDTSADFSLERASEFQEAEIGMRIDTAYWRTLASEVSARFLADPKIYTGRAYFQADILTKYFVNSEGSRVQTSEPNVRLMVIASTKADDGMSLPLYRSYFGFSPEGLPAKSKVLAEADDVIRLLGELRQAPLAETFSGPAILSGEASGVFFHEIFGHRVEGHRQKDPNSSQTFKSFVGKKILPDFIDVVFDPTIKRIGSQDVVGYFKYDDEGIPAQKVVAVEDGIFKSFLMSRAPIDKFPKSNGHGRKQAGYRPVTRQSNLMVQSSVAVPFDSLRTLLRQECKKQNKEYGLYFVEISGGFTFTGRTVPNAFNVQPLLVYKIFADGRKDQLVRGVDLIGTPLTTFNNIASAANDLGIFNGVCGAESGGVPVSASSPSLFVTTIEVQKKQKSQSKPPLLPSPVSKAGSSN